MTEHPIQEFNNEPQQGATTACAAEGEEIHGTFQEVNNEPQQGTATTACGAEGEEIQGTYVGNKLSPGDVTEEKITLSQATSENGEKTGDTTTSSEKRTPKSSE